MLPQSLHYHSLPNLHPPPCLAQQDTPPPPNLAAAPSNTADSPGPPPPFPTLHTRDCARVLPSNLFQPTLSLLPLPPPPLLLLLLLPPPPLLLLLLLPPPPLLLLLPLPMLLLLTFGAPVRPRHSAHTREDLPVPDDTTNTQQSWNTGPLCMAYGAAAEIAASVLQ